MNDVTVFTGQTLKLLFNVVDQDRSPVDLALASSISVVLKQMNGASTTYTGVIANAPGTDGVVEYDISGSEIQTSGVWKAQVIVVTASGTYPTSIAKFTVKSRV